MSAKRKIGIALALLLHVFSLKTQVLTLDSIFNRIEKNNPSLKIYDARISAFDAYATGARALDPPQVGAGFFMTPYNTSMWKADEMNDGMGSFMISAQQMFFNPVKRNANQRYMQGMSNVEREMKAVDRNELFSMAKMEYYELAVLKRKIRVIAESREVLEYMIKSAEIRFTYGMDKLDAYYKAKAMLADMQQMMIMTESDIAQKKITLNSLMYRNLREDFDIDTALTVRNYESETVDSALITSSRSEVRMYTQNVNLLQLRKEYEYSKRLPDFGIRFDHMIAFGRQPQQFTLMGMVTIPLAPWSSGMYKASVKGISNEVNVIMTQQKAFVNEVENKLQRIRTAIASKKAELKLYETAILSAMKKNYDVALLAYEQNTQELFIVLDAWQNLKISRLAYLDTINQLMQLQVQYERETEIR